MNNALRSLVGAVILAAATVLTWWLWLGRDTEYQIDANGVASGPYTTGQVAGCVLTLLVLLVAAVLLGVRPLIAAAAMTIAFTVAWTAQAAADGRDGPLRRRRDPGVLRMRGRHLGGRHRHARHPASGPALTGSSIDIRKCGELAHPGSRPGRRAFTVSKPK